MPKRVLKASWWKGHGVQILAAYILLAVTLVLLLGVNNKASTNKRLANQARDIACVAYEEDCTEKQAKTALKSRRLTLCGTFQYRQQQSYDELVKGQAEIKRPEQKAKVAASFGLTVKRLDQLQRRQLRQARPWSCSKILGVPGLPEKSPRLKMLLAKRVKNPKT